MCKPLLSWSQILFERIHLFVFVCVFFYLRSIWQLGNLQCDADGSNKGTGAERIGLNILGNCGTFGDSAINFVRSCDFLDTVADLSKHTKREK